MKNKNVAFFFDTVFIEANNEYYAVNLTYDLWKKRYLSIFNEMSVTTRVIHVKNIEIEDKYKKSNGKNVIIKPIENYNNIQDAFIKRKSIRRQIDKIVEDADCIIARMPSVISMFAIDSAKKKNKPILVEMVACPFDGYNNHTNKFGKIIAPFMFFLNRKYVKRADYVAYVTSNFLQHRYPSRKQCLACSDVVINDNSDEILSDRKNNITNLNINKLKIATLADVGLKYKGQQYMIEAVSKLNKLGIKCDYYLIGGGNNSRLKKIAHKYNVENQVKFVGIVKHDDIYDILSNMDVYIQPSLQEGLPRALIEAMSIGLPCIGSNCGGIPELLDSKYIFKKKKVDEIVKIIKNFSKNLLLESAERNFYKSKEFLEANLNSKRSEFYSNFKKFEK